MLKVGRAKYLKCPSVQNVEMSMTKTLPNLSILQIIFVLIASEAAGVE
jgi:hypothetical protein